MKASWVRLEDEGLGQKYYRGKRAQKSPAGKQHGVFVQLYVGRSGYTEHWPENKARVTHSRDQITLHRYIRN